MPPVFFSQIFKNLSRKKYPHHIVREFFQGQNYVFTPLLENPGLKYNFPPKRIGSQPKPENFPLPPELAPGTDPLRDQNIGVFSALHIVCLSQVNDYRMIMMCHRKKCPIQCSPCRSPNNIPHKLQDRYQTYIHNTPKSAKILIQNNDNILLEITQFSESVPVSPVTRFYYLFS